MEGLVLGCDGVVGLGDMDGVVVGEEVVVKVRWMLGSDEWIWQ